ncbi:MAG: TonB-dependent receptor domain-containing protein, partial [Vicinamibacteraceae bacterium]
LFFFGSGQARPLTDFRVYNDTVPTPAMFQGDFSHLGSLIVDPATGEPFPDNRIAANRVSSASRYFEPNFLTPNGDGGAFRGEASRSQDIYEYFGRLDYQLSAAQRLYGRWIYSKSVKDLPQYKPELVTSDDTAQHNVAINYSHTLSSSVLLTATAGYLRSDNRFEAPGIGETNPSNEAGIQGLDTPGREAYIGPPAINVTGYTGVGLPFGVNGRLWSSVTNAEVSITALHRLGQTSHSLSAGYEWNDRTTFGAHGSSSPRGSFTFNGQYTGNGFADYLLGLPSSTDRNYPLRKFGIEHSPYSGLFAQDNVQITPTLSAMFGVRYEYWHAKGLVPGNSSIFDPRTGKMVASENENGEVELSYQPVARFLAPATEGLWITASEAGMDPGLFEPTGHWAPRFGLTWRAHPSVVVRAGYGHYFNSFSGNRTGSTVNIPYWTLESQTFTNTQLERWETAWPEDPTFFIAPVVYSPIYDFGATRSEQFNASVQVALPLQSALTLAYVGARYEGQAAVLPQNEVPPGQYDDLAAARPYQGLSNIWMIAPAVDSSYDSLQVKWERRYANGFSAIVSYAWSKNIAEHQANGELASVVPFAPPGYDRGRSDDDRTHLVSVAAVYYLPIGRDKPFLSNIPRAVDALIGGWELSAVNTFQSGMPLTFWTQGASLGNGWGTRANLVGDPHIDEPTRERWFNTEAFAPTAPHTWGDSGIGVMDGPSYNSLDLALAKNFSLGANRSLQVRFEMFNALNQVNLGTPVTTLNDANFGRILSAGDPRAVQIGARFQF